MQNLRGDVLGCLENFLRCGRCHRFKVDTIAKSLNPLGEPIDGIVPPPFVEVARSQLVIRFCGRHSEASLRRRCG
jgi:hypothetical protein